MKPQGRDEWRVILELLRMIRVFTARQRESLMLHGKMLEEYAKQARTRGGVK